MKTLASIVFNNYHRYNEDGTFQSGLTISKLKMRELLKLIMNRGLIKMQKIEKKSMVDIVTERIKSYIRTNQLSAGNKLPSEKEWIAQLGVSRTVIRESLKSLQIIGIIRIKPGEGIFVDDPSLKNIAEHISYRWKNSAKEMKELLASRIVLELGAIEMAVLNYDLSRIAEMKAWNDKMLKPDENRSLADHEFHRSLFKATGNSTYFQLSQMLNNFFNFVKLPSTNTDEQFMLSHSEHQEIINWILRKNIKLAKKMMLLHLEVLFDSIEEAEQYQLVEGEPDLQ
ncbi:HTH-type transcriptional regulator LutR [compost metagenome]